MIADGNPLMRQIRTDRGIGDGGVNDAVSRAFHEFTFKAEYAYNHGMPQWLARMDRVLSPLRPERLFLGRHKYSHFRIWYRDNLANYVPACKSCNSAKGDRHVLLFIRRNLPGRIERAQHLMLWTDMTLSRISFECGFSDQSHFSRAFVKAVGETPRAWRRTRLPTARDGSEVGFSRVLEASA